MKRIISLMLMALPLGAMAQIPEFSNLVAQHGNNENVTVINIDKNMMALMGEQEEELKNIELIELIMTENKELGNEIATATHTIAKECNASTLISHNSTEEQITVYTLSKDEKITNIILVISAEGQYGASVITGEIATEDIHKLIHVQM